MLTIPLLTAAASAGLLGGIHCAAMCGSLTSLLMRPQTTSQKVIAIVNAKQAYSGATKFWLHTGRLSVYMSAGGVLGLAGQKGLFFFGGKTHIAVVIAGYLALAILGLRLTGVSIPNFRLPSGFATWQERSLDAAQRIIQRQPYIAGLLWGTLPCGLLYAVVPLAIFSGDMLSGALLMAVFGLCALPHLLVSQKLLTVIGMQQKRKWFSLGAGLLLIGLAVAGIAGIQSGHMPDWLCVVPPK